MRDWGFWEWLAYGTMFVGALILAADTGVKLHPELQEYFWFMHSAAWGFAPLILLVAGAIVLIGRSFGWVGSSKRRTRPDLTNPSADFPTPNWHEPLEPVVNKEFRNQEVELDGKNFVDCRFINVTFRYNGTMPIQFSNCTLLLLCHKFRYLFRAAQHGQRDSIVARAATNLRRIVAIEFGTWRSGRNGGSSGLVTFA